MTIATSQAEQAPARVTVAEAPVPLGRVLRYVAAATSLGAAAVHASAIAGHSFSALHLLVFVAMTVFQAWWAYLVLRSLDGRVLALGAAGHGAILVLWLVSRTTGIPDLLPGSHPAEAVELKDGAAAFLALATIAAIDVMSRREVAGRLLRPSTAGAALSAAVLAVVVLAGPAVLASGHDHATAGHTHDQPHDP